MLEIPKIDISNSFFWANSDDVWLIYDKSSIYGILLIPSSFIPDVIYIPSEFVEKVKLYP